MNKLGSLGKIILKVSMIAIIFSILLNNNLKAQNVAITDDESYSAESSAMLDVKSTSKGMLVPRLTSVQRGDIINPAQGLMVYDTNLNSFMYYNGSVWIAIPQLASSAGSGEALFAVVNNLGDTVFAVYQDGVTIFVDPDAKGRVGGFAVSGRTPTKSGEKVEYFRVTPDSTRIYVNDSIGAKGRVGGFAVSGRTPTKDGTIKEYFTVNKDSTRIYIDSSATKGRVGGFAVSGRTPTKGFGKDFLYVTQDSTRVFVNESNLKSIKYGFSVSGLNNAFGAKNDYLNLGEYSSKIINKTSITNQKEWASWNLLVNTETKYYDTIPIFRASRGNILMMIPYAKEDLSGNFLSTFDMFIKQQSKAMASKIVSIGTENISIGTNSPRGFIGKGNLFLGNSPYFFTKYGNWICGDNNIAIGFEIQIRSEGDPDFCMETNNSNILIGASIYARGNNNISLGNFAGSHQSFGVNKNIMIGDSAGYFETESNRFYIDNIPRTSLADQQAKAMFYGKFNVDPVSQYLRINAKISIGGAWSTSYALDVTGNTRVTGSVTATNFIATMSTAGAYIYNTTTNLNLPDYVFDKHLDGKSEFNPEYKMLNMDDLRQFINMNRHLPRVPSRQEIEKEGVVNLQAISMITLEKVEENTLYILELEEITRAQQQQIQKLEEQNALFKSELEAIKAEIRGK